MGFSFASDWSRKEREFLRPITERSLKKPVQSRNTLATQLKIGLMRNLKLLSFLSCSLRVRNTNTI